MIFTSRKRQRPVLPLSSTSTKSTTTIISRPIRYYTEDSLHFNSSGSQLFGEIYSKESLTTPNDGDDEDEEEVATGYSSEQSQRSLSTIFLYAAISTISITSMALYAAIIPLWERNFEHTRSPAKGDWTDGLVILPLSISFLSSTYMSISALRRRRAFRTHQSHAAIALRAEVHRSRSKSARHNTKTSTLPFYTILLSSTLSLLLAPLLILASTNSLSRAFRSSPSPSEAAKAVTDASGCNVTNIMTKPCIPILYRIGELQIGAAASAGVVCSLWIAVLVLSVRMYFKVKDEEERRRAARRKRRHARRRARRQARRERQANASKETVVTEKSQAHVDGRSMHSLHHPLPTKFPARAHAGTQSDTNDLGAGEHTRHQHWTEPSYRSSEQIIGLPQPPRASRPRESLPSWLHRQQYHS